MPRENEIRDWLIARLSERLDVSATSIDAGEPLATYGLSSREAVGLSGELEEWLGRSLSPTLAWEYPTVNALAEYLARAPAETEPVTPPGLTRRAEPIAVVGLGCRFPGAGDPEAFWELLRSGGDAISEVPADRWPVATFYHPDSATPGTATTRWGGFLERVDGFDAAFFGISPREASRMDPQHRLLLEVAWEALEHAGIAPDSLRGSSTGVFVGLCTNDYSLRQLSDPALVDAYAGIGNAHSIAANRLSYLLDLRGPSLAIDTACSSSLVAVHLACQSLRTDECRLALAAGVNLLLAPQLTIAFSKASMMAADGRCKTFDAAADGYVRGEGCGVVALKRLSDALADGNRILAVVRGSAVNQDGLSNGLTAPNGQAQQAVIRDALGRSGVAPDEISCIEAHGTGTPLGDPIEVDALRAVLMMGRDRDRPCALASVKTNLGHLEAAAGVAGFIKTVLALEHGEIPPHLHQRTLNPHIALAGTQFFIPTEPTPWPATSGPRRAGVSSFGFGGTNAHIVLEQAPARPARSACAERTDLLVASARTETALRELCASWARRFESLPATELADACTTSRRGRNHFRHRLAVTGANPEELGARLRAAAAGDRAPQLVEGVSPKSPPKVAFLFTGQGSQWAGMGRELYETEPVFRRALDYCEELLRDHLELPLFSVLWPGESLLLSETAYTQPAIFSLEYALTELWRSFGVEPCAVIGHSVGELPAACTAGVLSLEDALPFVALRGKLMQSLPRDGAMAAVLAPEDEVALAVGPYAADVTIAGVNGPQETVISGREPVLAHVIEQLAARGIKAKRLSVSHAFHSPLMDPVLDALGGAAAKLTVQPARIPLVSNVTGSVATSELLATGEYWRRHAREPVQFASGMQALRALGCDAFLEIGPAASLVALGQRCIPAEGVTWTASMRKGRPERGQLLGAVAALYLSGVPIDWAGLDAGRAPEPISLPTYPFERQRHWFELGAASPATTDRTPERLYEIRWRETPSRGEPDNEIGRWLVLADRAGVGAALAREIELRGGDCTTFDRNAPIARVLAAAQGCRGVVHLFSLDGVAANEKELMDAQASGAASALALVRGLLRASAQTRLWFVTRRAQPVTTDGAIDPTHAPLWGFGRVLALEHPELWGGLVDIGLQAPEHAASLLAQELLHSDAEDQVAYRDGRRYAARLERRVEAAASPYSVSSAATYLITGGLGGVGLAVAGWLVERGARHVVLTGRSAKSPSAEQRRRVAELEGRGAKVRLAGADVSDGAAMAALFEELGSGPPIRGIFHAAGVADETLLCELDQVGLEATLRPKVAGAWVLHRLTRDLDLDLFVSFSSMSSLLGSSRLGAYAAANAFLDALAHHRVALGLPATSINWGPWAEVGMAAARNKELERIGITAFRSSDALKLLEQLLGASVVQALAAELDWSTLVPVLEARATRPLLAQMRPREALPVGPSPVRQRLDAAGPRERDGILQSWLRAEVALVLGSATPEAIDLTQGVFDMGFDSLMALDLKRRVEKALGLSLPRTVVFEFPTIAALATHLASACGRAAPARAPEATLSENEAKALLLEELESLEAERTR